MIGLLDRFTRGFVLWAILFSAIAYALPGVFAPLKPGIVPGLGLIMFGMGMTLVPADFSRVAKMPRAVGCGILGQFLIMPVAARLLAETFGLDDATAMGFVILGSCPGGTASNVIAYLARADVALSVTMTACSTVLAVALTPLLVWTLGGEYLPVDPAELFWSVTKIMLIPVTPGIAVRQWLGDRLRTVLAVFPAISVTVIVLIIACIVALSGEKIASAFGILGVLVFVHNGLGLGMGYGLATLFRLPEAARRTVAIEVGMQNSGLGVILATTHFNAVVALPSSLFSVAHNVTGSALASWWSRDTDDEPTDSPPPAGGAKPRPLRSLATPSADPRRP